MPAPAPPSGPALRTFAERRVRGVPEAVVRGLFAWDRGERTIELWDLLFEVPPARRVLALQARGRRCVCLLDDTAARAHGEAPVRPRDRRLHDNLIPDLRRVSGF